MSVTQQKLMAVLRERVNDIVEGTRVPGYQRQLLEALSEIVFLEREHLEAATQIQKKVTDKAYALGTTLYSGGWKPA